ncbi:Lipase B [Venturia nashicola]|nr:Lipase B [Venturia nashicola]
MLCRGLFCASVLAASIPLSFAVPVVEGRLKERGNVFKSVWNDVEEAADDVVEEVKNSIDLAGDVVDAMEQIAPTATPASVLEVTAALKDAFSSTPTNLFENIAALAKNSLVPGDLKHVFTTYSTGCNSVTNVNSKTPNVTVYPTRSTQDAPFSLTESQLREVIYIPSTFTYGQVPPIVMVPGTGSAGCLSFGSNFIKQFTGSSFADPVWLNIPDLLLRDAQINAEYVAYALNYISSISSKKNISVMAWSQGNLDTQWALKYWPYTRSIVNDFISISPDFHGTNTAFIACPNFPNISCAPAVIQQEHNSNFIFRLRKNDGDSAYVPTTSIYSSTDEIVQPMAGTGASAYILDARNVGVSTNQVHTVCNGKLAGIFATHESVLYHPLAYALVVDALTNPGAGQPSRLDLDTICDTLVSPGLSVADIIATEGNHGMFL